MRLVKLIFPGAILMMGLGLNTLSFAKPEYTKKEKKACTVCHTKMGTKDLNETGKCYEQKKALDSCNVKQ